MEFKLFSFKNFTYKHFLYEIIPRLCEGMQRNVCGFDEELEKIGWAEVVLELVLELRGAVRLIFVNHAPCR